MVNLELISNLSGKYIGNYFKDRGYKFNPSDEQLLNLINTNSTQKFSSMQEFYDFFGYVKIEEPKELPKKAAGKHKQTKAPDDTSGDMPPWDE